MADVQLEPLFPSAMAALPLPAFMDALPSLDDAYSARVAAAAEENRVLRYVASVADGRCKVGLQAVPRDEPAGRLKGTDNILQLHSDVYYRQPLVIQGSGAGPDVTASGVVADMVDIALRHLV